MKTTPYTDLHIKLGAKMAEFAGYNMPIQYTGLVEEHNNVRNNVGVFDVSHMGEFRAKGPIAKHFMQYVTTNNVEDLFDGKVQYTCLPNGQGGVVDDMLVYRVHDDEYFMVPNAANIDKDWNWMSQIADKMGMELGKDFVNESEQWAQLAVQGPNALKAMQKLTSENIVDMEYYTFKILTFAGIPNIILSTTGYTGAGGCEIYIPKEKAIEVWDAVFEAGKEFGIMPAGLGCRDTLRLEKGFALYGHEMDEDTTPLEAGLQLGVRMGKPEFIGREAILAAGEPTHVRAGLVVTGRGIVREHMDVYADGRLVGQTTSGTFAPHLKKAIAMARIEASSAVEGTPLTVDVRGRSVEAVVVPMPFYKHA